MNHRNYFINIIGQLRIYSLVDLILFAFAIKSSNFELAGIVLLHVSFLYYLESIHKHSNRILIPKFIWVIIGIAGIVLYTSLAVLGFIIFSILYAKKNSPKFSPYSSFFRGAQMYFLAAGVVGFLNPLAFLAFGLLFVRNFAGDLRDIVKDRKEKMKPLTIMLGLKHSYKWVHLIILLVTTFVWWYIADISIFWLMGIYVIQILTYNLTPR